MPNTDIVSACADMIVRARKLGAAGTAGTAGARVCGTSNVLVGFPFQLHPSFFSVEVGFPSKSEDLSKIAKKTNFCRKLV